MHAYKQTNNEKRRWHAKRFSSQSAMEYLMTYGWAILIIAVVLAALFELGVFNPYTFAAKAQPGSCSVYRPDGAGTNNFISLLGPCTNEIPQYAAQFNGQNGYIIIPSGPVNLNYDPVTLVAWVDPTTSNQYGTFLIGETAYGGYLRVYNNGFMAAIVPPDSSMTQLFSAIPAVNKWYFVADTYNGTVETLYVDGVKEQNASFSITPTITNNMGIGACYFCGPGQYFFGLESNVQIYNTALSQPDIQALYKEGIGGVPIDLNNLVGWWPLNGNANDYSGNGNNGNAINVSFTGGWYKGYTAP